MKRIILLIVSILLLLGTLEYTGVIWHNGLFAFRYEVKGLDVSHHQGKINWNQIQENNNYRFVFIKATEGHDFIDKKFSYNWQQAQKYGFLTGAYHFFSMRSSGEDQAKKFISIVPKEKNSLPPVIDVEIHLQHDKNKVRKELRNLAGKLQQQYEKKPILYVTYDTYNQYIKGDFHEFDIWIRDILKFPTLDNRKWLFWQYSNRGRVDGIDTYVDINVFNGDYNEFKKKFSLK
ncbi:GH25 family lysozyme [Thermoflavimicrobium daqui]|uniref:Glycoside hydrolase n=1 Tax=Thermoflavimicrobium daqui TaxID=2137476 RepID=A0A364K482_9BACL|nr:GH25 family lysozyme [Thermoflavimicrobium daqui]RAL24147.1 glycoside hydrolase [Thermoflavimicrobium daqui]